MAENAAPYPGIATHAATCKLNPCASSFTPEDEQRWCDCGVVKRDAAFTDCLRLRDLADRQTLTNEDRADLSAIADRLHALLVSRIVGGRDDTGYKSLLVEADSAISHLRHRRTWPLDDFETDRLIGRLRKASS